MNRKSEQNPSHVNAMHPSEFRKPFSKEGKDGKEGKDDICAMVDHGIWE